MFENHAVRLTLQPLRKCIDAVDCVDAWHDEYKEYIASSRAEIGLSTEQTADHRKFVVTDVERSLDTLDPLGLTKEIETVAANLGKASFSEIANQFKALTDEGDETGGDDQIPMDAFRQLMDIHFPRPRTNAEVFYSGQGRMNVGDTVVILRTSRR